MDGLADIDRVRTHFNGQRNFTDHVAGMRTDDAATDDAMRFGIKQ